MANNKERVAIIGSGNWGSAISKIIGDNVKRHSELFEEKVLMWVYEEQVDGKPLTQIINEKHENAKYLPGVPLPPNVVADPELLSVVKGATALVFVTPHQFIERLCNQIAGHIEKDAKAISLTKGVDVRQDKITIFPDLIQEKLGLSCSSLSGANIADEVATGKFSESTIGYRSGKLSEAQIWQKLFDTPSFRVSYIDDVAGVALSGALKNVVAVAAGLVDGLEWGNNSKAAIMRIGLLEMKHFCEEFFQEIKEESFLKESCGVADLITSCMGGRNRRCAEAFVKTGKSFEELEVEMLNGQKLQGTCTAEEIHRFLKARGREEAYPLFLTVYQIAYEGLEPKHLTKRL